MPASIPNKSSNPLETSPSPGLEWNNTAEINANALPKSPAQPGGLPLKRDKPDRAFDIPTNINYDLRVFHRVQDRELQAWFWHGK